MNQLLRSGNVKEAIGGGQRKKIFLSKIPIAFKESRETLLAEADQRQSL